MDQLFGNYLNKCPVSLTLALVHIVSSRRPYPVSLRHGSGLFVPAGAVGIISTAPSTITFLMVSSILKMKSTTLVLFYRGKHTMPYEDFPHAFLLSDLVQILFLLYSLRFSPYSVMCFII